MLVSHVKKFIYLKAHKVGGTSIEVLLEKFCRNDGKTPEHKSDEYVSEYGIVGNRYHGKKTVGLYSNHTLPDDLRKKIGDDIYNSYFKICSIRNPYDLMVSLYHWRGNIEINKISFQNFIKNNSNDFAILNNKKFWNEPNTFIIRYENLKEDLLTLSEKLDLSLDINDLNHYKKSVREKDYKVYYNEESKKMITKIFSNEIEKFNYSYE